MRNIRVTSLCALLFVVIFTGCNMDLGERGNGQIITEEYDDIGNFNRVNIAGSFEVVLRESNRPNLIVITDENLIDYIEIENENGELTIRSKRKLRPSDDSRLIVEYTELEEVDVAGAAVLSSEDIIEQNRFDLNMSGAGEVELNVDVKELQLDISGAGAVELRGFARDLKISMSGAGGLDAEELESEICDVSISGVGGASLFVTRELKASVSGVGGVSYRGNPEIVNKNVSGLGSIKAEDDDAI